MPVDIQLRVKSLLRRAGLSNVPPRVIVGAGLLCAAAIAVALWQFWPQQSDDFAYAGLEEQAAGQDEQTLDGSSAPDENASAAAKTEQLAVDVEGEVVNPGLYMLAPDSRVGDAVEAAGGMTERALAHGVNRAARVEDGMQVYVPSRDDQGSAQTQSTPADGQAAGAAGASGKVSLNNASAEELQSLPGIGPSLSQRIVDYRTSNGGFSNVEDLRNVSGIGDVRFENLKDLVCL